MNFVTLVDNLLADRNTWIAICIATILAAFINSLLAKAIDCYTKWRRRLKLIIKLRREVCDVKKMMITYKKGIQNQRNVLKNENIAYRITLPILPKNCYDLHFNELFEYLEEVEARSINHIMATAETFKKQIEDWPKPMINLSEDLKVNDLERLFQVLDFSEHAVNNLLEDINKYFECQSKMKYKEPLICKWRGRI